MKKMGRPPVVVNGDMLKKVKYFASLGVTQEQVASALGMAESTFYKLKAENAEFSEALKEGKGMGVAKMAERLVKQAESGNTTAIIFYLKCNGWKEASQVEVSTNATGSGMADFYKQLGDEIEKAKK